MPKAPANNTTRKPPDPSNDHADVATWLARTMPDLQPIVTYLDRLIRETIPGLHYTVKWKKAHYGLPKRGWIIEMVAYGGSVNLVFFAGEATSEADFSTAHGAHDSGARAAAEVVAALAPT